MSSLLTRFASGARGCLAGNRYSPNIGDGTDLYGTEGDDPHRQRDHLRLSPRRRSRSTPRSPPPTFPTCSAKRITPTPGGRRSRAGGSRSSRRAAAPTSKQLDAFCESIREGKPAKITGIDGLRAQEFVQGAYQSMRTGGWVDLPLAEDAPFIIPEYR